MNNSLWLDNTKPDGGDDKRWTFKRFYEESEIGFDFVALLATS